MLTIRDHQTGDLFDPWAHLGEKRRGLLDRSWAAVFREHLLNHLPVRELAAHFSRQLGRPTKDLHAVVVALILQQLHDTTDPETVEAVALNLAWQYALDIRADAYLCERTLRNYRSLLIERGLDQVLFRTLTDRLIEAIGVDTSKQRLDSTAIRSAMRGLTRLGILVEAIAKFLRELRRLRPDLHAQVAPEMVRKYVDREGTGRFASIKPSESRRRLPEAAADLLVLVTQSRDSEAAGLESYRILARVLAEQCEIVSDPEAGARVRVKEPEEMTCDVVLTPAEPDATYKKHRGVGYLVQVMETYASEQDTPVDPEESAPPKPDRITRVAVGPMSVLDGSALDPALADAESRGIKPGTWLGDSHHGSEEDLEEAALRGVEVVAPAMAPKGSQQGKLTLEDFELGDRGHVTRRPGGQAPQATSEGKDRIQASFDPPACAACPPLALCPASAVGRKERRFQYTRDRVRNRERRPGERTEGSRDRYRWRSGIEGTMSRLRYQMHLAALRVRGRASVGDRTFPRASGLSIRRVAAYQAALRGRIATFRPR